MRKQMSAKIAAGVLSAILTVSLLQIPGFAAEVTVDETAETISEFSEEIPGNEETAEKDTESAEEFTDETIEETTDAAAADTTDAVEEDTTGAVEEDTTDAVEEDTTDAAEEDTTDAAEEDTTDTVEEDTSAEEEDTCTITLDLGEGRYVPDNYPVPGGETAPDPTPQQILILENVKLNEPVFLQKDEMAGYQTYVHPDSSMRLMGWALSEGAAFEDMVPNPYTPTGDVTLYAVWEPVLTLTFDANGGCFPDDGSSSIDILHLKGSRYGLEVYISQPVYEGKQFKMWSLTQDGSEGLPEDRYFYYNYMEDTTIYAIWESGSWIKDSKGWWYRNPDGSYPKNCWKQINGKWYRFDASGYMLTGWQMSSGKWYYLDPKNGDMKTGWQKIGNKWYYLNTPNGDMKTGWHSENGKWYYLTSSGAMATGWQQVGGKWYVFNGSGAMLTGWQKIGNKWYYLNTPNGDMKTGWHSENGKWYYLTSSGAMAANTWVGDYYMTGSGVMATDRLIGDDYVGEDGKKVPKDDVRVITFEAPEGGYILLKDGTRVTQETRVLTREHHTINVERLPNAFPPAGYKIVGYGFSKDGPVLKGKLWNYLTFDKLDGNVTVYFVLQKR